MMPHERAAKLASVLTALTIACLVAGCDAGAGGWQINVDNHSQTEYVLLLDGSPRQAWSIPPLASSGDPAGLGKFEGPVKVLSPDCTVLFEDDSFASGEAHLVISVSGEISLSRPAVAGQLPDATGPELERVGTCL